MLLSPKDIQNLRNTASAVSSELYEKGATSVVLLVSYEDQHSTECVAEYTAGSPRLAREITREKLARDAEIARVAFMHEAVSRQINNQKRDNQ